MPQGSTQAVNMDRAWHAERSASWTPITLVVSPVPWPASPGEPSWGGLAGVVAPREGAAQTAPIRCGPQAGPTPAPQCYSGPTAIEIVHAEPEFHFLPPRAFVQAGITITWTNVDYELHTVTADDGSFASGVIRLGERFSHTFDVAGGFAYHCDFHPNPTSPSLIPRVIVTS